jgi:hypothetical protein
VIASIPIDNHPYDFQGPLATFDHDVPADFANFLALHVRNSDAYARLQNDLIDHLWRLKGNPKGRS